MAEFLGAAAGLTQLAKYSLDICNGTADLARRMRQAPTLLQQQRDHASSIICLLQTLRAHATCIDQIAQDALGRCIEEADKIHASLTELAVLADDGKFTRVRKKFVLVRKEKEIDKLLCSIGQRSSILQMLIQRQVGSLDSPSCRT